MSQASDVTAAIATGGYTKLERSLDPCGEFLQGTDEHIGRKLRGIQKVAAGQPLEVWADAIYFGGRDTVKKAKNSFGVFERYLGSERPGRSR